jgi:hypothetical protein
MVPPTRTAAYRPLMVDKTTDAVDSILDARDPPRLTGVKGVLAGRVAGSDA